MSNARRRFLVYPAGPIQGQAKNILEILANLRRGQEHTARLFSAGFSPFPVFTDFAFLDMVEPTPLIEDVYAYSLAWMEKADALYMLPGWEHSTGARAERDVAERLSIPVFFDLPTLCEWADGIIEAQRHDPVSDAERIINRSDD